MAHDEHDENPLAGPLSRRAMKEIEQIVDALPAFRRVDQGGTRWCLAQRGWNVVDVWLTSDGSLFVSSSGPLAVVASLMNELVLRVDGLAIEDCTYGVLHSPATLLRQLQDEVDAGLPWVTRAAA